MNIILIILVIIASTPHILETCLLVCLMPSDEMVQSGYSGISSAEASEAKDNCSCAAIRV